MREQLCHTLAQYMGQTLTSDVAVALVRELFPDRSRDPAGFESMTYGDYVFAVERLRDIVSEIHPLHEAHFLETEKHRLGFGLDVNYPYYLEAERDGRLLQLTLRVAGKLVGNIRMFVGKSLHTGTLYATEDTFYVLPEYRKGIMAVRFWQYMERAMRQLGALEIRTDSKTLNRADRLNVYMGYTPIATKFIKVFPLTDETPAQECSTEKDAAA